MMLYFDKLFDTAFDDVFQQKGTARLFHDEKAVLEEDLRIRFMLSLIAGQTVLAPLQLLLDHRPFRSLLFNEKWRNLIFRQGLLRVGPNVSSWDEFIREIGGGSKDKPPLYWTTDETASEIIREIYRKEGPDAAYEEFLRAPGLFQVRDAIEEIRRYIAPGDEAFFDLGECPPYRPFLLKMLRISKRRITDEQEWKVAHLNISSASSRSDAREIINDLKRQGLPSGVTDELWRVAVEAKHDQLRSWVKATHQREIPPKEPPNSRKAIQDLKRRRWRLWEVPLIGSILNDALEADALEELAKNTKFIDLRQQFRQARIGTVPVESTGQITKELCTHAANILGKYDIDGSIQLISGGTRSIAMSQSMLPGSPEQSYMYATYVIFGWTLILCGIAKTSVKRAILTRRVSKSVKKID